MTLRQVTPANSAAQLTINYDGGGMIVTMGQIIDVPPGSALESAIGLSNLTPLAGTAAMTDDQQGDGSTDATDNS